MIDISTPVVVLKSAHHGGLGITRSLGRLGIAVYVVDADPRTSSFPSRYCKGKFVWDIDRAPASDSLDYLAAIGRTLQSRAILIPAADTAALFVAAHASELSPWFHFCNQTPRLVLSLYSKKAMNQLAVSQGIPTPKTFFPTSKEEALQLAESVEFPVILKAIEDRKARKAGAKVIVHRKQELLANYEMMEDPERPQMLVQEYIPGGDDSSWMFNGYFDENSDCLFGLTGRKIRQYRPYAGVTSLGVCLPNPVVAETTRRFMKAIGYRGILDIGYRYDNRDGKYKVFDVNPRIGCTFRLFVSDNGMDVARSMYLNMTGQPVAAGSASPGRNWRLEDLDLLSACRYWRDGNLSPGEWLRSFDGIRECAFFAKDDPGPLLSMCANRFRQLLRSFWDGRDTEPS